MVSSIMTLFLAVLLHPEVQKKAQDEIDAVTGRERFPNFEDRPRLPFVDALCKEVLRWRPAAPLRASYTRTSPQGEVSTHTHIYAILQTYLTRPRRIGCITDCSYRRVREISLYESLKRFSDHYLTRCLVDWKYLVRRVHDCLCGDFSFFAGRSHTTRMCIQSPRSSSPSDFSILMGHCGTTMLR
jgi:Cytochrome P450